MSGKAATADQIISLPKGGGALRGIGEKFAPELQTGTGNFSVPIELPPGRNGFQPQLQLAYSTGNPNSAFGQGWSLTVPGIQRKTSKGVPRYDDSRDTFVLSGAEDLVRVPGGPPGATRYRPRTEGLFARILHHHGEGEDYWEVWTRDGLVSIYGTRGSPPEGTERAVVADPDDAGRIFAWRLTETTDELYRWMAGVLGSVYGYLLQQATAMAQLAERQLAFERQEQPPSFIRADYWIAPSRSAAGSPDGDIPDRRGLTGSARLLRDLTELDQYAFETNRRKLQLTHTISLARAAPGDFQRFRETGVLPFATPMEMFDRSFPGHYLRTIRRVRVSVVGLIPPMQGIRATLTVGGASQVVVGGGDLFQTITVRRTPELVAFTAPTNASGVFELDPQPELLFPFEGRGVAASGIPASQARQSDGLPVAAGRGRHVRVHGARQPRLPRGGLALPPGGGQR